MVVIVVSVTDLNYDPQGACVCCIEPLKVGEWIERGLCGHPMHTHCMLRWAMQVRHGTSRHADDPMPKLTCPYCRAEIAVFEAVDKNDVAERMVRLSGGNGFWKGGRVYASEALSRHVPPPPEEEYNVHIRLDPPHIFMILTSVAKSAKRALLAMAYICNRRNEVLPSGLGLDADAIRKANDVRGIRGIRHIRRTREASDRGVSVLRVTPMSFFVATLAHLLAAGIAMDAQYDDAEADEDDYYNYSD